MSSIRVGVVVVIVMLVVLLKGEVLAAQSEAESCQGFIELRLVDGTLGRVLPGEPNNVRAEPDPDAERVSQIPGGGIFKIIDGPICGNNGAWWKVEHQGVVGWTMEGQNNTYWTEPLDTSKPRPNIPYQLIIGGNIGGNAHLFVWDWNTDETYQLTFDGGNVHFPRWSPDGSQVVYTNDLYWAERLVVINADGSNQHEVYPASGFGTGWSPDGQWIGLAQFRDGVLLGARHVFLISADGMTVRQLTDLDEPDYVFPGTVAWSADGSLVYFVMHHAPADSRGIYFVPANVELVHEATPFIVPSSPVWVQRYAWSPDHQLIAVELYSGDYSGNIVIYDAVGNYMTSIFSQHNGELTAIDWAPDGSGILISGSRRDGRGTPFLYFVSPDGSEIYEIEAPIPTYPMIDWRPVQEPAPPAVMSLWSVEEICPGFMPTRLTIGRDARVTPGDANNVRSVPATDGELVGAIPGGASFNVRNGPVCTTEGLWWLVDWVDDDDSHVLGWTLEGRGNSYWLEPYN